jgi:hypothetical protein
MSLRFVGSTSVIYATTAPNTGMLGQLWLDTSVNPGNLYECTNLSPLTYTLLSSGGGGFAPVSAQYVVLANDATLTAERVLTAGTGITITDGGANNPVTVATPGVNDCIALTIDGGGSVLATGNTRCYFTSPFAGTIQAWYLSGDPSGSLVIDVWKAAGAIPTVANTITGAQKPTLTAQQLNSLTNLNLWTPNIAVGDVLGFNVDSVTSVTKAVLSLKVLKV